MLNSYNYNSNQKFNTYLSNCDLINKYNFKSSYEVPNLKKIIVEVKLKDFLLAYNGFEQDQTNTISQIKAYLLMYSLCGFIPYLNCNKNTLSKFSKNSDINYSLKVTFSSLKEKNFFLTSLFVENWSELKLDSISIFDKTKIKSTSSVSKSFGFSTVLPGNSFFEVTDLFQKGANIFNSKLLKFHVNFLISNSRVKHNKNLIKNLQFFWING